MSQRHAVSAHWAGDYDEPALERWAAELRTQLEAPRVALGLVFISPRFFDQAQNLLEILRLHARIPLLAGCSSPSLIAGEREIEAGAGVALGLYDLPGAQLKAHRFTQAQVEEANGPNYWHAKTGVGPEAGNGWLVFADPFRLDAEAWLRQWNEAYPGRPIVGGLASGDPSETRTQVYLNGEVFEEGGVAISVGGALELRSVISQGCTPIGETWTITKVERNLIREIGNRRAHEVLVETYNGLSFEDRKKASGNLFVGLVINEYLEDFHRGDFLIRNLLGTDPKSGVVAVGAWPRRGQTLQFHRRDARAATEDMIALLDKTRAGLGEAALYGGCLCCCNGRGQRLFGAPDHDAGLVRQRLGVPGLAGFFCNGEIGPVGERNFLHGYTASLALFVGRPQ